MKRRITLEAIRRYGKAAKDPAALHFDPETARKAGFERPIAHGMHIMGLAHSMYLSMHPVHWIQSAQMTFRSPLLSGTTVHVEFGYANEQVQVTVVGEHGEIIADGGFVAGRELNSE